MTTKRTSEAEDDEDREEKKLRGRRGRRRRLGRGSEKKMKMINIWKKHKEHFRNHSHIVLALSCHVAKHKTLKKDSKSSPVM